MKTPIEILEDALTYNGGYILIPQEHREVFEMSDGHGDDKKSKIKSIISVCENPCCNSVMIRTKVMDEDDIMWDAEEYLDESHLKDLVIICGKIDNKSVI